MCTNITIYLFRAFSLLQEHIRQSRENRLDELGRKSTPCPISASRTDLHDHGSESPSLEVIPSKELLPPTTMITQEYTKDLVLEMTYNTNDMNDIHQSNNMTNATQERLQESSEEPEMRDNYCQTRESLFEPRLSDTMAPIGFTTFGIRGPSSQNGTNHRHYHLYHQHHQQESPQRSHQSAEHLRPGSQSFEQSSQQCSGCSPASRGLDGTMGICPKHNPIPAPPGWSTHESSYPLSMPQPAQYPEQLDYPSYQRFQSPKPSREDSVYRQSPKFSRQTVGSGERYGSSIYGSGHGSSNTTSSSQQSGTSKCQPQTITDPRYRAEAVIEVEQRRPFSIESTKSAPDVIATHWRRSPGDWEPYKRRHPRQDMNNHNHHIITIHSNNENKVTVATQSSLDDDASTSSTMEANSSSWSTCHLDAVNRDFVGDSKQNEDLSAISNVSHRKLPRIPQSSEIRDPSTHIQQIEETIEESATIKPSTTKESATSNISHSKSIINNVESQLDDLTNLQSVNGIGWTKITDPPISKSRRMKTSLKLHDLPILQPPEGFRVPIFKCRTPSLSWKHCACPSHTHLPPGRLSITRSAFERCNLEPPYRTWPNRTVRRFGRPSRRTVGTQSSLDGTRSSSGVLRCVVRSIDMTERSFDQEIGASIPF